MKKLSASATSFATAYSDMRNLNSNEKKDLLHYFALQYYNAPPYVRLVLAFYFHFVSLMCIFLNFKLLARIESSDFSNLCRLLTNTRFLLLGKLTISVRSLLEFKILELENTRCQKQLM